MHLIKALAAGIVGAESGTAVLYRRGTSTPVSYYTDFEGLTGSSTSPLTLDANGSTVVYVNEFVRVVVKSSTGAQVREFVDGAGDANVEVTSPSFTGTDYSTLLSEANKPTTLREVLAKWLTSAGATDFEVDISGTALTLQAAATGAYGMFFNVRSSVYGATGNGTTDDYAAIVAAIAAAAVAGGIVFFPAGTYKTSAAISVPASVSLLGAGATVSIIKTNHASADVFDYAGSPTANHFIEGLTIASSVSNSGQVLDISNTEKLLVRDCVIGGTLNTSTLVDLASGGTPSIRFDGCKFIVGSATLGALLLNGTAREGRVDVVACEFVTPATFNMAVGGIIGGSNAFVRDCVFNCAATTSGTFTCFYAGSLCYGSMHGCEFVEPASGTATITCMALGILSQSTEWFVEDANMVSPATTHYTLYSYTHSADGYFVKLGTRETRYLEIAATATPCSLGDLAQYGVISVRSTYAGNIAYTASAVGPMGCKTSLFIVNGDASTRTITLTTNMKTAASYSLLTNEGMGMEVVAMHPPAGAGWYLTAFSGSDAGSDGYTI